MNVDAKQTKKVTVEFDEDEMKQALLDYAAQHTKELLEVKPNQCEVRVAMKPGKLLVATVQLTYTEEVKT